ATPARRRTSSSPSSSWLPCSSSDSSGGGPGPERHVPARRTGGRRGEGGEGAKERKPRRRWEAEDGEERRGDDAVRRPAPPGRVGEAGRGVRLPRGCLGGGAAAVFLDGVVVAQAGGGGGGPLPLRPGAGAVAELWRRGDRLPRRDLAGQQRLH